MIYIIADVVSSLLRYRCGYTNCTIVVAAFFSHIHHTIGSTIIIAKFNGINITLSTATYTRMRRRTKLEIRAAGGHFYETCVHVYMCVSVCMCVYMCVYIRVYTHV